VSDKPIKVEALPGEPEVRKKPGHTWSDVYSNSRDQFRVVQTDGTTWFLSGPCRTTGPAAIAAWNEMAVAAERDTLRTENAELREKETCILATSVERAVIIERQHRENAELRKQQGEDQRLRREAENELWHWRQNLGSLETAAATIESLRTEIERLKRNETDNPIVKLNRICDGLEAPCECGHKIDEWCDVCECCAACVAEGKAPSPVAAQAATIERLREALDQTASRLHQAASAIASLPDDALGYGTSEGYRYPLMLELLAACREAEEAARAALAEDQGRGAISWTKHAITLVDGEPCGHPGCLSHISHPCEGCGRIGGVQGRGEDQDDEQ
jgi:hypothetical protein